MALDELRPKRMLVLNGLVPLLPLKNDGRDYLQKQGGAGRGRQRDSQPPGVVDDDAAALSLPTPTLPSDPAVPTLPSDPAVLTLPVPTLPCRPCPLTLSVPTLPADRAHTDPAR